MAEIGSADHGAACGDAVRRQLARVFASPDFHATERLRGFITYVVEEALAGRGERVKAYAIATVVFGRGPDFDNQNDPVVRIEAGNLRRALERYYLTAGRQDAVVISIPKGGYKALFETRAGNFSEPLPETTAVVADVPDPSWSNPIEAATANRAVVSALVLGAIIAAIGFSRHLIPWADVEKASYGQSLSTEAPPGPSVLVQPLTVLTTTSGSSLYAEGLTEELITQLARFKELKVFGRETSYALREGRPPTSLSHELKADFRLEGSVRIIERNLRVMTRLVSSSNAQVVWSRSYDRDLKESAGFGIEEDIASSVATAVAQPYGAIFRPTPIHANSKTPAVLEAYGCLLHFYHYRTVLNAPTHATARDCLEKTTTRYPNYATGWAMLAYLYLDEDRFDLNRRPGAFSGKARAREAADRSAMLDPSNVRCLQALMTVLFFSGEPASALAMGEKALAINPNDTELLAEVGSRVAQAGDWERGGGMLEQALARNPGHSGLYVGLIAQAAYMLGNDAKAVEWIRRADLKQFSIYHFVAALIFARAGLQAEAVAARSTFLQMRPRFFDNFEAELAMRNFNARDRALLSEGAKLAGFLIPAATK